jgi:sugar-phosphatase
MGQPSAPGAAIACQGLLFDCDGVLVDSDASVRRAWSRWARSYGLPPDEVTQAVHGRRSADTVALLIEEDRRAEALARIDRYEVEDAATVTAVPGAEALLRSLPGPVWAVVTSGVAVLARARLAAAALPEPTILVTADDVAAGKPAPDGYLAAAGALGLPAAQTVVLEDSGAGVAAARAAGVGAVVGVGARALATDAAPVVADLTGIRWHAGVLSIPAASILRG